MEVHRRLKVSRLPRTQSLGFGHLLLALRRPVLVQLPRHRPLSFPTWTTDFRITGINMTSTSRSTSW